MRLRLEIESPRLAPAMYFDVLLRAPALRHRLVRHVRNARQRLAEFIVELAGLETERRDPRVRLAHLLLPLGRIHTLFPELPYLGRFRVLQRLELLGFRDGGPSPRVQVPEFLDIQAESALLEPRGDRIQIGTKRVQIVHRGEPSG
jgi:hypothetical protein